VSEASSSWDEAVDAGLAEQSAVKRNEGKQKKEKKRDVAV